MIELPEAVTLAGQMNETLTGKTVTNVAASFSPHGFAFYFGDPAEYNGKLAGRKIERAVSYGCRPEIQADGMVLSFDDGVNVRYLTPDAPRPKKHQLLVDFDDGSSIVCTVQMYGGMNCFKDGANDNFYYTVGKEKPSPLTDAFDFAYFASLLNDATRKLSAKAFLATEQRIPGLGNGVLQDILWRVRVHPKRKMNTLTDGEFEFMFNTVKEVLREMTKLGGRDTEKDLFGKPGGYVTVMSKKNELMVCPACGGGITRAAYLGGNVYFCGGCQKL